MKPAACPNCPRADKDWRHEHFTPGCPQCDIRKLARSKYAFRIAALDHMERHLGPGAMACLREKLRAEDKRITALKKGTR